MGMARPIPRSLLGSSCVVCAPLVGDGYGSGREVSPVRFERVHGVSGDVHQADCVHGVVYVDAEMPTGPGRWPLGAAYA